MPVVLTKSTGCCALFDISRLETEHTPEAALDQIYGTLRKGNLRVTFLLFTGVTKNAGTYHAGRKDDYGGALEDLIDKEGLGDVWHTGERQSWTGNMIRAWIWAPDMAKFKEWYGRRHHLQTEGAGANTTQPPPAGAVGQGAPVLPEAVPRAIGAVIEAAAGRPLPGGEPAGVRPRPTPTAEEAATIADFVRRRRAGDVRLAVRRRADGNRIFTNRYQWRSDGAPAPNVRDTATWRVDGWLTEAMLHGDPNDAGQAADGD